MSEHINTEQHDPNDAQTLLNLVRYDSASHPFVDRSGHLSLSFSGPATIGPEWLHPRSMLATYQVIRPVLKLWSITEDARWNAVRRTNLRSWPWEAEEEGDADGVGVAIRYVFETEQTIFVDVTLSNAGKNPVGFDPAWTGSAVADSKLYMLDFFDGAAPKPRRLHVRPSQNQRAVEISFEQEAGCDLTAFSIHIECTYPQARVHCSTQPAWGGMSTDSSGECFVFRFPLLQIESQSQIRFGFRISIARDSQKLHQMEVAPAYADTISKQRRALLAPLITGKGKTDWLVKRARLGLIRCSLRGLDGEFGESVASLCTSDSSDFSCSFFWDSLFSSVALTRIDAEMARGAISTAFVRQLARDGSAPERKFNFSVPQRMAQQASQSPIGAWALNQYLRRFPDKHFARQMYSVLAANHRFWLAYSDVDQDGLAEFRWTGQICDNSPLWDFYGLTDGKPAGCQWIPPVASVPLNSFLYRDAIELAHLCDVIGNHQDQVLWKHTAAQLAAKLTEVCFVEKDRRFWDYNHHTNTHRRIRTFWMFWPLWAGVPVAAEVKRELIEDVLLDPKQFFGAIPFPSVAYDEKTYSANGYWRGKAWPHVSTWLVELLAREGYMNEAKLAAKRLLAAWAALGGPSENLATDAKQPHGGFQDYNWGCAAVILLDEFLAGGTVFDGPGE